MATTSVPGRIGRSWRGTWGTPPPPGLIAASRRARPRAQVYEGATMGRRARGWLAPTVGSNTGVLGNLTTLRDRSRSAVRNDGVARSALDRLVTNLVGSGIKPLSTAPDPEFRERVQALWLRSTDFSDGDGLLDVYGQQALAVRTWLEGGEAFVRLRARRPEDALPVPLQLQILEPELCPHTYNTVRGANRVRAGIEFTPIGARAAYWMYRARPGDLHDFDASTLVRVPAETVIHLYDPVRAGQLRGLPQLTQALVKLHDLDQYDDATLLRQKIANLFVGFITKPGGAEGDVDPLTGRPLEVEDGQALVGLEPALFQELAPGEAVAWSDPPDVGTAYGDFMRQQMLAIAAAVDVPYEVLTGDLTKVTDRTVRVILTEFRRRITQRQHQIVAFQLCRPVWAAWFDRAVLAGALEVPADYFDDPTPYRAVKWVPQGWAYLHPVQDVQAHREAVRAGFTSRAQVVSELGEDVEAVDAEIAADNARADALGLAFDSDGRKASGSAAAGAAPGEPSSEATPSESEGGSA